MADSFNLLDSCGDELPVGTLVDRVSYHRFVALHIPQPDKGAGPSQPAVFPPDHAVPDIVREVAFEGFPPIDLVKFRGGFSLIREFEEPAEECGTVPPLVRITVPDVDDFLAAPTVTLGKQRVTLPLTRDHVEALGTTGSTLVRAGDQAFLVDVASVGAVLHDDGRGADLVVVDDVASVVIGDGLMVGGHQVALEGRHVRELREQGESLIRLADSDRPVRIVLRDERGAVGLLADGNGSRGMLETDGIGVRRLAATGAPVATAATTTTRQATASRVTKAGKTPRTATAPDYTVPTYPFVLYLPYRQDWTLVGYARGDLLNSIALAPQEEATIEISSWDRSRRSTDVTDETSWESSLEAGTTNRLSRDLVGEITRNESWKLTSAGVQVGVPQIVDVGINLGGDWGTAVTSVSRGTVATIDEATSKAAFRARGMRQTKVSEAREWGFEERSTRKLRNPNTGRTVTYDAFEVLAAYDVTTYPVPDEVRLAVQVPSPVVVRWDRQTLIVHEGVLARALLDPAHAAGFEAARWLAAREEYLAIEAERALAPKPAAAAPVTAPSSTGSPAQPQNAVTSSANRVLAAGDAVRQAVAAIGKATPHVASSYDSGVRGAALETVILEYRQWLFRVFGMEKFQPGFWSACQRFEREFTGAGRTPERVEQLLNETGSAWLESVGRIALSLLLFGQWTLALLAVELIAHHGWKTGWYAQYTARGFDDAGLGARITTARTEVENWRKALSAAATAPSTPASPAPAPAPEAADPVAAADQPAAAFPDADTAHRRIAERALLAHLEQHRSHYVEAIWRSIGPADRARLIDATTGNLGAHVSPEVLGFLGDTVVVPFHTERFPAVQKAVDAVTAQIRTEPTPAPRRTVLPTPAVHLQVRVGNCDALEPFLVKHRSLDVAAKRADVRRSEAEADVAERQAERLKARLEADPPLLDADAGTPTLAVRVVQDADAPAPGPTP